MPHENTPMKGTTITPVQTQELLKSSEIKKFKHGELVEYATNVTQDLHRIPEPTVVRSTEWCYLETSQRAQCCAKCQRISY